LLADKKILKTSLAENGLLKHTHTHGASLDLAYMQADRRPLATQARQAERKHSGNSPQR